MTSPEVRSSKLDDSNYFYGHFYTAIVKITLLFVVIALICLVLNQSSYPIQLLQKSYSFSVPKDINIPVKLFIPSDDDTIQEENVSPLSNDTKLFTFHQLVAEKLPSLDNDENDLESRLKNASMDDNKTVIITTLNAAWTEPNSIFDFFLESFKIGIQTQRLLNHLLVVALDKKAYSRCLEVHHHCYFLKTEGVDFSGEAKFMANDYLKMMWRRIEFLGNVLKLGYNLVFTDADIMWFRDPFKRFYPNGDFQIACDNYLYNSINLKNKANGGFNYVKSSNRTIEFYKFWYTAKNYFPRQHDQEVFDRIKFNPFVQEIGLEIRFLNTVYFGGFCQPSKDLDLVVTMHANCCIRINSKIHDIKMLISDWKRYMGVPIVERNSSVKSWTVPRICRS